MKQVSVLLTCDACHAWKDREVSTDVATVSVSAEQTLDLCPEHRDALSRVWALVAEWGVSPTPARRLSGRARTNGAGVSARSVSAAPPAEADPPADAPGTAPQGPKKQRGGKRARARRANATAASTAPPGSFACPLCTDTPSTAHALTQHFRARHNRTGSEVYGAVCPVCNHTGTAQGLGTHGRLAHGLTPVAALFAAATAAGDPHGVIASRVEAFGQAADV